ncbi:hypothetical protein LNV23_17550 [Paucibacter sp. DJ1R-11]|uniref:hypothetical protein n=1 Tax=Paucibacter sp. DJ1R-11 TaxID=2893556 RepID=UPI0021E4707C|nr:hypothetical protein [Paucibacter sp. DJ1R-11]MCV2365256.1 hypothetical protein [Paucibacter sp. DJ1R-11]
MINAVSSLNESPGAASAVPARASVGDEVQRRRSLPAKLETNASEAESAVVAISSEGARRAQAAPVREGPQSPPSTPAVAQEASPDKDSAPISLPADSPSSVQVSTASATDESASKVTNGAAGSARQTQADLSTPNFDEADANQDGAVDVMERKIYDFNYPTLDGKKSAQAESAAEATRRQTLVELKAYEDVARSGRSY